MITAAEVVSALTLLEKAAEEVPALVKAVESFANALVHGKPVDASVRHAEAVAMALELGLDPNEV